MTDTHLISQNEQVFLLAIMHLGEGAYGVAIRRAIKEKTGQELTYGALYFTLGQLTKKDFVEKRAGEPSPKRGGRRRFYYSLTEAGKKALQTAYEFHHHLWKGLDAPLFEE
ncbi:MAG: PadR family transcriptional regulator [Candidatus Aminicenantes bacterium]|nr:PadR family transcriptional regulator [Candidatus Aminicenantes bacterium]